MRNKKTYVLIERFLLSPVHPVLYSVYYVFSIYAFNIHDILFLDFVRPVLLSMLLAGVVSLSFYFILRSKDKAAFITSIILVMFYSYDLMRRLLVPRISFINSGTFAWIWALLMIILILWVGWFKKIDQPRNVHAIINLMAIILLLFPLLHGIRYVIAKNLPFTPLVSHAVKIESPRSTPDIYFIILDSYSRADVLKELYGFDNSEFIQSLKDLGFYVAECSQSNYVSSAPSLASSLNFDYLQNLSDEFQPDKTELLYLFKLLENNAVKESLSSMGYETVAFATGFPSTEWRDADTFIAPAYGPVTEFETVVLLSSYARIFDDFGIINFDDIYAERYRERTHLILDSFDDVVNLPGPKFVYIHFIVPHTPFAFDKDGNPVAPDQTNPIDGYVNQVMFINKFILPKLQMLIDESESPPVIILQGDHGQLNKNKAAQLKILNAYYLPDGEDALYPSISPANSFRVIFNSYFGTEFPLLTDVSYYSSRSRLYDFTVVENACP